MRKLIYNLDRQFCHINLSSSLLIISAYFYLAITAVGLRFATLGGKYPCLDLHQKEIAPYLAHYKNKVQPTVITLD